MSISFADNILNETAKALDDKTGVLDGGVWRPYNSVSEALGSSKLVAGYRYVGLTICILKDGKPTEYWWKSGIADNQLIIKVQGAFKTTISEIRSFSGELPSTLLYTTDLKQEGNWYYDPLDTTSIDNTGTILKTLDGKRIKRIYEQSINLNWFGAFGNDTIDDSDAIQGAIDNLKPGEKLIIPYGQYRINKTITLNKYSVEIDGNKSELIYTGTAPYAFDCGKVLSNIFPLNNIISDIAINITGADPGTTAWGLGCSTSRLDNLTALLGKDNQVGFEIKGDTNGTGSYYNIFTNLRVQGNSLSGQTGVKFSYNTSTKTRCPNANTFIGGRVGQCFYGWVINGNGNALYNPTVEGTNGPTNPNDPNSAGIVFNFEGGAPSGCTQNAVYNAYIEGAPGAKAFVFNVNAVGNRVYNPYITSIGTGASFTDNGIGNEWLAANNSKVQSKGYVLSQTGVLDLPTVLGASAGYKFKDVNNNNELLIRNGSASSLGSDFFVVQDNTSIKTLFKVGSADALLYGNNLRFRNDAQFGLFSGTASPEGAVIAKVGSVFMNTGGDIGKSAFVKETGAGNAGWKPIQSINSGTSAGRPTVTTIGYQYFDTTLGKPIWWGGADWKDASGATV